MDLKPLDDRIILRKKERPEVTAGGLILPDIAKIESKEGVVVAVLTVVVIPGIVDVALKLVTVPVPDSKPAKSSSEIL